MFVVFAAGDIARVNRFPSTIGVWRFATVGLGVCVWVSRSPATAWSFLWGWFLVLVGVDPTGIVYTPANIRQVGAILPAVELVAVCWFHHRTSYMAGAESPCTYTANLFF